MAREDAAKTLDMSSGARSREYGAGKDVSEGSEIMRVM